MICFNIPGLGNSGPDHWQSHWERKRPGDIRRIRQENWDKPVMQTWTAQIQGMTQGLDSAQLVFIGHSVGCAAIIHWYKKYQRPLKGALLVAPSDVERDDYPSYITGFNPLPMDALPFPTVIVASSDDHVVSSERAREMAQAWGSDFVEISDAGHIESKSGYGVWEDGLNYLDRLMI